MARRYDLRNVRRGDDFSRPVNLKQSNGTAFDATGSELRWVIEWPSSGLIEKSTADGSLSFIGPESDGMIALPLTAVETLTLPLGKIATHRLIRRFAGISRTLMEGLVDVTGDAR
jgi:hypothetical protein